jgi:hypothetical protein
MTSSLQAFSFCGKACFSAKLHKKYQELYNLLQAIGLSSLI